MISARYWFAGALSVSAGQVKILSEGDFMLTGHGKDVEPQVRKKGYETEEN